jgi:hypothetical protein
VPLSDIRTTHQVAYGWFMGADVHVRGGPLTVILGLAVFALCINAIRAVTRRGAV